MTTPGTASTRDDASRSSLAFKSRWLGRRLTSSRRPLPDFLIIGAQKSGTTALLNYIGQHPGVRPARAKELHFFDRNFRHGSGWYRANFPLNAGRHPHRRRWLTGEASPFYMFHPGVPARAARLVPAARLIAILRNPVDRAYSHYNQQRQWGNDRLTFAEAIDREGDRISAGWDRLASGASNREVPVERFSYVERGRYAEQLERWLAHFPRPQLLVLRAEDLSVRPQDVVAQVFDHLGLAPYDGVEFDRLNARSYEPMDEDVRQRLNDYYREPVHALQDLLQRDFEWAL